MYTLELIPDELSLIILSNLAVKDLLNCRIVSHAMRTKIDRLYNHKFCITLNEKSEGDFLITTAQHPYLIDDTYLDSSRLNKMQVGTLACSKELRESSQKDWLSPNNFISLRKNQFTFIRELEFCQFIKRDIFLQIIETTGSRGWDSLRVLKLNSAALGGAQLFTEKPQKWVTGYLMRMINLIPFISYFTTNLQKTLASDDLIHLDELQINLDYVPKTSSSSERPFSPLILVENMKSLHFQSMPNLQTYRLSVEKSKDGEQFFFSINALLGTIPASAYPSLQTLSILTPKLKPISNHAENCLNFSNLHLSELSVKVEDGYKQPKPVIIVDLVSSQKHTLKSESVVGFTD